MGRSIDLVQRLQVALADLKRQSQRYIYAALNTVEVQINSLATPPKPSEKHLRHLLGQLGGREVVVDFELLVGLLISSTGDSDIQKINPVLTKEEIDVLKALTVGTILQVNRLGHILRCEVLAKDLRAVLRRMAQCGPEVGPALMEGVNPLANTRRNMKLEVMLQANTLAGELMIQRHYVDPVRAGGAVRRGGGAGPVPLPPAHHGRRQDHGGGAAARAHPRRRLPAPLPGDARVAAGDVAGGDAQLLQQRGAQGGVHLFVLPAFHHHPRAAQLAHDGARELRGGVRVAAVRQGVHAQAGGEPAHPRERVHAGEPRDGARHRQEQDDGHVRRQDVRQGAQAQAGEAVLGGGAALHPAGAGDRRPDLPDLPRGGASARRGGPHSAPPQERAQLAARPEDAAGSDAERGRAARPALADPLCAHRRGVLPRGAEDHGGPGGEPVGDAGAGEDQAADRRGVPPQADAAHAAHRAARALLLHEQDAPAAGQVAAVLAQGQVPQGDCHAGGAGVPAEREGGGAGAAV
eukprot:1182341-Prorocentrum_minimum.AAC.3